MQADAVFFLDRPWPTGKAIDVGCGPLPDVVLEVDHTTDVRRRKAGGLRVVGVPRGVGGSAGASVACAADFGPAATDDLPAGGRRLRRVGRQPGVWGLAGGGDPPGAERGEEVGGDRGGGAACGPQAGQGGRHGPRRRPVPRRRTRREPRGGPCGRPCGRRARDGAFPRAAGAPGPRPRDHACRGSLAVEWLSATTDTTAAIRAAVECRDAEDFLRRVETPPARPDART